MGWIGLDWTVMACAEMDSIRLIGLEWIFINSFMGLDNTTYLNPK